VRNKLGAGSSVPLDLYTGLTRLTHNNLSVALCYYAKHGSSATVRLILETHRAGHVQTSNHAFI